MFRRHPFLSLLTLAYLGVVGWLTLGPQPLDDESSGFLWQILDFFQRHSATDWISYDRLEFATNVLMFIPIGAFFVLLFGRKQWWLAIVLGICLTAGIEFTQQFIPGRIPDLRDIVSNTSGTVIGVLVALVLTAGKARRLRRQAQPCAAHS